MHARRHHDDRRGHVAACNYDRDGRCWLTITIARGMTSSSSSISRVGDLPSTRSLNVAAAAQNAGSIAERSEERIYGHCHLQDAVMAFLPVPPEAV